MADYLPLRAMLERMARVQDDEAARAENYVSRGLHLVNAQVCRQAAAAIDALERERAQAMERYAEKIAAWTKSELRRAAVEARVKRLDAPLIAAEGAQDHAELIEEAEKAKWNLSFSARDPETGDDLFPGAFVHLAVEDANHANEAISQLAAALTAEVERRKRAEERAYRLALAICGGEDVPGYLDGQPTEVIERVARDNSRAWSYAAARAEAARDTALARVKRLEEALRFYASESLWDYDGMPDSMTPMERDGGQVARAALQEDKSHE